MWRAPAPQPLLLNLGPGADVRFEAFFLAAKHTFYSIPTLDVLTSIYGKCPPVKDMGYFEADPYAAVFDIVKPRRCSAGSQNTIARF